MTESEIKAELNKLQTEPRYTTVKGVDTEFYVKSFSIVKGNVNIKTTITTHAVPLRNMYDFLQTWRQAPKAAAAPKTAPAPEKSKPAKLEVVKDPTITGAAAKYVHITSPVKVYVTTDYKIFRHTLGNRMLNKNKVKKIVSDIKAGFDRLADFPILVDPADMKIKDGQHRLESAMQTQKPIYYILAEPMELHEIARVNSNTERWKAKDFINCYVEQGNEHYKILQDFIENYHFPLSSAIKALSGLHLTDGGNKANLQQRFEQGQFTTSDNYLSETEELADLCERFDPFPARMSASFIVAIDSIHKKGLCDFDRLIDKFKKNPDRLKANQNRKEYINSLELIYNLNAHKRDIIF